MQSAPLRATPRCAHETPCRDITVGGWLDYYNLVPRNGLSLRQVMFRLSLYYPELPGRLRDVPCVWSNRLGTAAGYASPTRGITMHPALQREGLNAIITTLLHEVAHMAQYLQFGVSDHGATWHEMMYLLGERPTRTHRMTLNAVSCATPEDLGL